MASDDELRAKLTKALIDASGEYTSASGGWAMRQVDALMPVVREALADAWDDGFDAVERNAWVDWTVLAYPDNPWRGDT